MRYAMARCLKSPTLVLLAALLAVAAVCPATCRQLQTTVGSAADDVATTDANIVDTVSNGTSSAAGTVADTAKDGANTVADGASDAANTVGDTASDAFNTVKDAFQGAPVGRVPFGGALLSVGVAAVALVTALA